MEITVSFTNYKEPTISSRNVARSVIANGIFSAMQSATEEYIDFENLTYEMNGISYPLLSVVDIPYRYVCKYNGYDVPSISKHIIAFAVNRDIPFVDSYNIKANKPKTFTDTVESSFEVTGVYLNEEVLQSAFNSIPNDLVDYQEETTEDPVYDDYTNLTRLDYGE